MIESVAQAVVGRVVHRYLAANYPGTMTDWIGHALTLQTVFSYAEGIYLLVFSDMRLNGVQSLSQQFIGDSVSREIEKQIPFGEPVPLNISFSGQGVVVETGFIPNFVLDTSQPDPFRLTAPHERFGLRWNRVDLRVYQDIIQRQSHIAPFPSYRSQDPTDMLWNAVTGPRWEDIEIAIRVGAHIEKNSSIYSSPLAGAAAFGNLDACKLLLALGAHPDSPGSPERPVVAAHRMGHRAIVDLLLSEGANPDFRTGGGYSFTDELNFQAQQRNADQPWDMLKRLWR